MFPYELKGLDDWKKYLRVNSLKKKRLLFYGTGWYPLNGAKTKSN